VIVFGFCLTLKTTNSHFIQPKRERVLINIKMISDYQIIYKYLEENGIPLGVGDKSILKKTIENYPELLEDFSFLPIVFREFLPLYNSQESLDLIGMVEKSEKNILKVYREIYEKRKHS